MFRAWCEARGRILTPNISATRLDKRGFHIKDSASRQRLEGAGGNFITGFRYAAGSRNPGEAELRLETIDEVFRGFAYEGAAMGFAIMDAWWLGGGRTLRRFLAGRAERHVFMAHVGIGWALARLPRWRWRSVFPEDPQLRWLALDGYGFHQAYFHTGRYVRDQVQDSVTHWPVGRFSDYVNPAIDQGIGRALWFVEGSACDRVATAIERFPAGRRAELWAGAGLAATYAGGTDRDELEVLWSRAGDHRSSLAQGSAFAALARDLAGLMVPHTRLATSVFCGMPAPEAAAMVRDARPGPGEDGPVPGYETWRQRIANEFVSLGRC